MFRKLRNKFLILNMTVTSLVMILALGTVYFTTYNNVKTENEKKLDRLASSLIFTETIAAARTLPFFMADSSEHTGGGGSFSYGNTQIGPLGVSRMVSDWSPSFVITTDGIDIIKIDSSIEMQDNFYIKAFETTWNKDNIDNNSTANISERQWMYRILPVSVIRIVNGGEFAAVSADTYQMVFLETTDTRKTLQDLLFTIIFVSIGLLAGIFIISYIFANRSIKPISESWEKQKKFVADASHELKTPLSTIMVNYDVLISNEEETIKSQHEWLDYIKIGIDRMNTLVSNLLTLAKNENMNNKTVKLPFNMNKLICRVIQSMDSAAQSKNLRTAAKVEFKENITGYEEQVGQVLTILYDNAIKYSNENGKIDIEIKRIKKSVVCSVKNTGQGIAQKDLPYIFDRFYRSDTARSSESSSYGLGLAIAKSICGQIGGKITVQSVENKWAEFIFTFDAV